MDTMFRAVKALYEDCLYLTRLAEPATGLLKTPSAKAWLLKLSELRNWCIVQRLAFRPRPGLLMFSASPAS